MCVGEAGIPTWIHLVQELSGLGAIALLNFLLYRKTSWYRKYMWLIIVLSIFGAVIWTGMSIAGFGSMRQCV